MGQINSGGVSSCLCCGTVVVVAEADRWWKENHLFLVPPIAEDGNDNCRWETSQACSENEIAIIL